MAKALGWLAQREHSSAELKTRLERWLARMPARGDGSPNVDEVIQALQAKGYLSDERFVQSRLRLRSARFGNRRIEHELHLHGTHLDAPTRQHLQDTEFDRAWQVWQQRFGSRAGARGTPDLSERARQQRFLTARGFSAHTVARVLKRAAAPEQGPSSDFFDPA